MLAGIVIASMPTAAQVGVDLYIYGGRNNDTFLGCITCGRYDSSSVFNRLRTKWFAVRGKQHLQQLRPVWIALFEIFSMQSVCVRPTSRS